MSKPVKDEIFGSRKSILKNILNLRIFENTFFATCLHRINPDPASRYILLHECASVEEYTSAALAEILPFIKQSIPAGDVLFQDERIKIKSLRNNISKVFYQKEHFAGFLLDILRCRGKEELHPSNAKIIDSGAVSPLSRFLRQDLFGRVSSTDIDFIIHNAEKNRLALVEEKLHIHKDGGSIGRGQYLSFRELLTDAFSPGQRSNIGFFLIFFDEKEKENCFVYDFLQEYRQPARQPSFYDSRRKEQRIIFPFREMEKMAMGEFLGNYIFR